MSRESSDQRAAVFGFEFDEFAPVDEPGDDVVHVVGNSRVDRDHVVDLGLVGNRIHGGPHIPGARFARPQCRDDPPDDAQRVAVVVREMIGNTGDLGVQFSATEIFRGDHFAGSGLHQRRAAEKDGALVADDHRLVAHRRDVRAAGRARSQHGGDLRDALGAEFSLVVEDPAEVLAVGKHLVLAGQEGAAGVDEIDAGQPILPGNLLRAQVLFDRNRVVGTAFDRRVVGHDHAFATGDPADTGDDAGPRAFVVVHPVGGKRSDLEQRTAGVEQAVDSVTGQQFAAVDVACRGRVPGHPGRPWPACRAAARQARGARRGFPPERSLITRQFRLMITNS